MIGINKGALKPFNPNLKLELKFNSQTYTDVAGTVAAGLNDYVRAWKSTVGGHLLTQATDAARPQRQSDGLYFDGGDKISCPDNASLRPGTADFSVSYWIKTSKTTRFDTWNKYGGTGNTWGVYNTGTTLDNFQCGNTNVGWTPNYMNGAWHFLEYGRAGTTAYIRCDGVQKATGTNSTDLNGTGGLFLGYHGVDNNFFVVGSITDFRLIIGSAPQYTTPPTRSA